jgi:hypothetical protein
LKRRTQRGDDEREEMQKKLDTALGMLADWCVAVDVNGTGWG